MHTIFICLCVYSVIQSLYVNYNILLNILIAGYLTSCLSSKCDLCQTNKRNIYSNTFLLIKFVALTSLLHVGQHGIAQQIKIRNGKSCTFQVYSCVNSTCMSVRYQSILIQIIHSIQ